MLKKFFAILLSTLAMVGSVHASEGGYTLDKFPTEKSNDLASLQNGAKLFVNYCLNCHSAAFMRYNRLTELGLTEDQIKGNLLFAADKVGETMHVSMDPKSAKEWFGAAPPDLTLIARSRASGNGSGADYLYTYLRTFYQDPTRPTGWNNLVFPNVGMPHVLWELQGRRDAVFVSEPDHADPSKVVQKFEKFEQVTPGSLSAQEFDSNVGDLVAYLQWMGEPMAGKRKMIGVAVLVFLLLFTLIAQRLNAAYWRDIK